MSGEAGTALRVMTALGVLVVIAVVVTSVVTGVVRATADDRGRTGAREDTVGDGTYRIARYDEFFSRCNAVVALEGRIADTQTALTGDDATQRYYDDQNLRAMRGVHRDLVGQYNAAASAAGTSGQFRDSDLPARLDPEGRNSCSV